MATWRCGAGERAKVLAEFAHTQSQLAFSYWQLGSEADGTRGCRPEQPRLRPARQHHPQPRAEADPGVGAPARRPTSRWRTTSGRSPSASGRRRRCKPRLRPTGAPEWAVWGRELLERFRAMSHHWADRQGPDGQLGGGWNDDTDFPGVFICLPLLGDTKTQTMFTRIFDGLEQTGYLHNGIGRGPIDALHATDFLSWRAHLMLFDYGQPRHVERALVLTRELRALDQARRARAAAGSCTDYYSEDGPRAAAAAPRSTTTA